MGHINFGRVITGGLAAGVVMNVLDYVINNILLKSVFDEVMVARNISIETMQQGSVIGQMVALNFAMAMLLVFTYAAIRPRFGAGVKTAVIASLIMAAATSILAGYFVAMGFFPWEVWQQASLASTGNFIVAGLVGAALYKE